MELTIYEKEFINGDFWSELIDDGSKKGLQQSVLRAFSDPQIRLGVIESIRAGKYEIEPPRVQFIPKDDGGMREVLINSDIDRLILAGITRVYMKHFSNDIHSHCLAYQRGISVPKILHSLAKTDKPGFKADLSKYFDSVSIEVINKTLDRYDTGCLKSLLKTFYNDHRVRQDDQFIPRFKSLAQGCAFSSFLANVILRDLDEFMCQSCDVYYRYSDDILVFDSEPEQALERLREKLGDYGLHLNPKKVKRIEPNKSFTFLGGRIENGIVDLDEKSIRAFKKKIKSYCHRKKTKSRSSQKQAIGAIVKYLYGVGDDSYSWIEYFGKLCTTDRTIRELEYWTREQIRSIYTGKHNTKTNANKTSNDALKELGWISMVQMYNVLNTNHDVYKLMRRDACERYVSDCENAKFISLNEAFKLVQTVTPVFGRNCFMLCDSATRYHIEANGESIEGLLHRLEDLYPQAVNTTILSNPLAIVTPISELPFEMFITADNLAYYKMRLVILALQNSEFDLGDKYYWQSNVYSGLILLKEWLN